MSKRTVAKQLYRDEACSVQIYKTFVRLTLFDMSKCQTENSNGEPVVLEHALKIVRACMESASKANSITMIFDIRQASNFSRHLISPFVTWLKSVKLLIKHRVLHTHVLLDGFIWSTALKLVTTVFTPQRPLFVNADFSSKENDLVNNAVLRMNSDCA